MRSLFLSLIFLCFAGCSSGPVDPCSSWQNVNGASTDVGLCMACVAELGEVEERTLRGCVFERQVGIIKDGSQSRIGQ